MAKSIRSKRRRKMRSVRREKFGKRELEMLKAIVVKPGAKDVDMKEIATVKDSKKSTAQVGEKMETNKSSDKYDPVTMKNEHGSYPVWMNHRKIRKAKKEEKKKIRVLAKKKAAKK